MKTLRTKEAESKAKGQTLLNQPFFFATNLPQCMQSLDQNDLCLNAFGK